MVNVLKQTPRVIRTALTLVLKRELEYKINLLFDLLLRFGDLFVYLLLWTSILTQASEVTSGWTFNEMILLFAFQAFFIVFVTSFSYSAIYMNGQIIQGKLDAFLTKPTIPWLVLWLQGAGLQITGLLTGTFALVYLALNGYPLDFFQLVLIIPMIFTGFLITSMFGLCLTCLTFWFGRLRGLDALFDGFWGFADYPSVIFHPFIRIIIAFTMPFLFIHTVPIQWITNQISSQQFLFYFIIELSILWFLGMVFYVLWSRGLKRYESFGG